jgi:hypothetical protein
VKRYLTLILCVSVAVCIGTLWAIRPPRFEWPRDGEQPKAFVRPSRHIVIERGEMRPTSYEPDLTKLADLCIVRHASTRCYGGDFRPWSRVVVDAMKGFR